MHKLVNVTFEPTTPPALSSAVHHTNLKDPRLTSEEFDTLSHRALHLLRLPGLQCLHIDHDEVDREIITPVLEQTQGSVLKLYLGDLLRPRTFSLCPLLELTLCRATAEDLKKLMIASDSRPCPALRRLLLLGFILEDDDEAHILQEFLVSRGLVPFNTPHFPPGCHQLERVSISFFRNDEIFQRCCLKVGVGLHTLLKNILLISLGDARGDVKKCLEQFNEAIHSQAPHLLILLEVCDIWLFSLIHIN